MRPTKGNTVDEPISAPLRGLLTEESETDVRIQVDGGVWVIPKADAEIAERVGSSGETAGRAVEVRVRAGASVQFVQTLEVVAAGRPMTLSDDLAKALGHEQLEEMARSWATRLQLPKPVLEDTISWLFSCDNINGCYDGHVVDHLYQ